MSEAENWRIRTSNPPSEVAKDINLYVISLLSNACKIKSYKNWKLLAMFWKEKEVEVHSLCVVLKWNDFDVIVKYFDANNQEVEARRHEWYRTFYKWMNKTQISDINNKWQQFFSFKFKTKQSSQALQI